MKLTVAIPTMLAVAMIGFAAGAYFVLPSRDSASLAELVIMRAYLEHYCYQTDKTHNIEWRASRGALTSQLTADAGLGRAALTLFYACKAGLKE